MPRLERSSAIWAVWVAKMWILPSDGLAFCSTLLFLLFISAKRVIGDVPQKTNNKYTKHCGTSAVTCRPIVSIKIASSEDVLRSYARTWKKLGNMSSVGCENADFAERRISVLLDFIFLLFISAKSVIGDVPQKTIKSILNTAALRRWRRSEERR